MSPRSAKELFDFEAFIKDVIDYMNRHHIYVQDMADLANCNSITMTRTLELSSEPSLATIIILADIIDVSLEKYITINHFRKE